MKWLDTDEAKYWDDIKDVYHLIEDRIATESQLKAALSKVDDEFFNESLYFFHKKCLTYSQLLGRGESQMAVLFQHDKRAGITYAYEATYHWDSSKKQSRSKRSLIGRVDENTGKIVPTDGRCRKDKPPKQTAAATKAPSTRNDSIASTRKFYGASYLLDAIGEKLGLTDDLKMCFPDTWNQILSVAYYLIMQDKCPLYRFEKWGLLHKHPYGADIPSQRSSDLFASITEDQKNSFFRIQGKRRIEKEYWAYDTTSISSYSETLSQVQDGKNKEDDKLPQINLAIVFGEKSGLPFYYRKLPGNMPDVVTVRKLLYDLDIFGLKNVKLVFDRGFFSQKNINELYMEHDKFLMGAKFTTFIKQGIEEVYDSIKTFCNYIPNMKVYGSTIKLDWKFNHYRAYKKDYVTETRHIYLHVYYNIDKATEEEKNLMSKLSDLRDELELKKYNSKNEKSYSKFFTIKKTKNGINVVVKESALSDESRYYGFFCLVSNEKMDATTALKLYRSKDVVEKAFGNLKERLNLRRLLVSSEQSLDGKLFVEFIALIYLSYINSQMHDKGMYKDYTMAEVFDKLDIIECFEYFGHKMQVGEVLEKQKEIYRKLGVEPPSSL
jgi:transposase